MFQFNKCNFCPLNFTVRRAFAEVSKNKNLILGFNVNVLRKKEPIGLGIIDLDGNVISKRMIDVKRLNISDDNYNYGIIQNQISTLYKG